MKKRIYLIGYMGTGKSHLGKLLSDELKLSFFDTDSLIESQVGMTISKYFSEFGESEFRMREKEILRSLPEQKGVYSCGGGMPCFHNNMDHMLKTGYVIWIKSSIDDIISRISKDDSRPLIRNKESKLRNYVAAHLAQRKIYYKQSQIKVWNRGPIDKTVKRMINYLLRLDQ